LAHPPNARGRHAAHPIRGRMVGATSRPAAWGRGHGTKSTQGSHADNSMSGLLDGDAAVAGVSGRHGDVNALQPPLAAMSPMIRGPRKHTPPNDLPTTGLHHHLMGLSSNTHQGRPAVQGSGISSTAVPLHMTSQPSDSPVQLPDEGTHVTLTVTPARPFRSHHKQGSPQSSPEVGAQCTAKGEPHASLVARHCFQQRFRSFPAVIAVEDWSSSLLQTEWHPPALSEVSDVRACASAWTSKMVSIGWTCLLPGR
jgi:hypothetical protein